MLWLTLPSEHALLAGQPSSTESGSSPFPAKASGDHATPRYSLPPLPAGVTQLAFSEFFKLPVGPEGLELSDRLKGLDGRRVRILGFMVQQSDPWSAAFLLSPVAVQLDEHEYGQADDLPPATLYVRMPAKTDGPVPYTPGLMLLTGTLHVGAREIESGRRTWVTLDIEAPGGQTTSH
jgi:hypothetical protein